MDTFPQQQPPGGSGGPKAAVIAVAVVVVLGLLGLGVFLLMAGGDDSGDDGDDTVEEASEDGEGDDEADLDDDGIPDAEDDDIDGDDVPDEEDEAPLDPDIPGEDGDDEGESDAEDPDDGEGDAEDSDDGDADDDPDDGDDADDEDGEGDAEDADDEETTPAVDLLRTNPSPAIEGWLDAAGRNAKAVEIVLYTDYGFATVRDTERPARVRRLGWRDGSVEDGELEDPFPGTDLDAESFKIANVNWDALPGLVANAPQRAGLPQGDVTHVIVTSDLPFSNRKIFRIYVEAPNGSDYVVATIDGQPADR